MFNVVKNSLKKVLKAFAVTKASPIVRIDRATMNGAQVICDLLDPKTQVTLRHVTVFYHGGRVHLDGIKYIENYVKIGERFRGHDEVEYDVVRKRPLLEEDREALAIALAKEWKVIPSCAVAREDIAMTGTNGYSSPVRLVGHTL